MSVEQFRYAGNKSASRYYFLEILEKALKLKVLIAYFDVNMEIDTSGIDLICDEIEAHIAKINNEYSFV